ncbi:MAG: DUF4445 domain-containing protein [Pseudomonadales bacterium]|nr:ATP-binding protein [Pseudomonadales bacterium]NIX09981.1 DUF4445 domain-containing protein [Pseudomonadales bacterium]
MDVDNLMRAKAAIYAGFTVLADSVGVPLEMVEQVLIGGSFGKYINVEKAVEIGLLPDMPCRGRSSSSSAIRRCAVRTSPCSAPAGGTAFRRSPPA